MLLTGTVRGSRLTQRAGLPDRGGGGGAFGQASAAGGGEFGFVVFSAAVGAGVMGQAKADRLTAIIVLSMVLTPLVLGMRERLITRLYARKPVREADPIADPSLPVLIAGFGHGR